MSNIPNLVIYARYDAKHYKYLVWADSDIDINDLSYDDLRYICQLNYLLLNYKFEMRKAGTFITLNEITSDNKLYTAYKYCNTAFKGNNDNIIISDIDNLELSSFDGIHIQFHAYKYRNVVSESYDDMLMNISYKKVCGLINSTNSISLSYFTIKDWLKENHDIYSYSHSIYNTANSDIDTNKRRLDQSTIDQFVAWSVGGIKSNYSGGRSTSEDTINDLDSLVRKQFTIKDYKVNGPALIIFWESGDKTVVKLQNDDEIYDIEKAIYAAFTKKALSFGVNSKDRSMKDLVKGLETFINEKGEG